MKNLLLPSIGMTIVFMIVCIPFCLIILQMEDEMKLSTYKSNAEIHFNSIKKPDILSIPEFNSDFFDYAFKTKLTIPGIEDAHNEILGSQENTIGYRTELLELNSSIVEKNNRKLKIENFSLNLLKNSSENTKQILFNNSQNNNILNEYSLIDRVQGPVKIDALPDEPWAAPVNDEIWIFLLFISLFSIYKIRIGSKFPKFF